MKIVLAIVDGKGVNWKSSYLPSTNLDRVPEGGVERKNIRTGDGF